MGACESADTSMIVADSSTAAVMKLVTKPARMPPVMRGTSTRRMLRILVAPKLSAASSSEMCTCCNAAMQLRKA